MPIHYEKRGRIVTITIDRPERRNALDLEHFGQLADAWVRFRDDDEAWLAKPRRGLFPGAGSTVQSVRKLAWCHAMKVLLLADRIPAARAYDMGLVNRVVPRERVVDEARAIADTICLNGPLAVRACKQSAKESTFLPLREALANESRYSATVFMSDDAKEGLAAFREKRAPVWRGR